MLIVVIVLFVYCKDLACELDKQLSCSKPYIISEKNPFKVTIENNSIY